MLCTHVCVYVLTPTAELFFLSLCCAEPGRGVRTTSGKPEFLPAGCLVSAGRVQRSGPVHMPMRCGTSRLLQLHFLLEGSGFPFATF